MPRGWPAGDYVSSPKQWQRVRLSPPCPLSFPQMSIAESPRHPDVTGCMFDLNSPSLARRDVLGSTPQPQQLDALGGMSSTQNGLAQGVCVFVGKASAKLHLAPLQWHPKEL